MESSNGLKGIALGHGKSAGWGSLKSAPTHDASPPKKHPYQHYCGHQPDHPAQAAALAAAVVVQPLAVRKACTWNTDGASGFAVLEVDRCTRATNGPRCAALAQVQGETLEDADALLETETQGVSSCGRLLGRRFMPHYGWWRAHLVSLATDILVNLAWVEVWQLVWGQSL